MWHARPMYRHASQNLVMRYHSDRWLLSPLGATDSTCIAYASCAVAQLPGAGPLGLTDLVWHFFDDQQSAFVPDPLVTVLPSCPAVVRVLGRAESAGHSGICGTYHLHGAARGRPVYMHPHSG